VTPSGGRALYTSPASLNLAQVRKRLEDGEHVRATIGEHGSVYIERPLPYLVLYRTPQRPDPGTDQLLRGAAASVSWNRTRRGSAQLGRLLDLIIETSSAHFDRLLLVEVMTRPPQDAPAPTFEVISGRSLADSETVRRFARDLRRHRLQGATATVEVTTVRSRDALAPLPAEVTRRRRLSRIELVVSPIHRDDETGEVYPKVLKALSRRVSGALQRAAFEFVRNDTRARVPNFHVLGRRAFGTDVRDVDRRLSRIASSFDLLLLVSPTNTDRAFGAFQRDKYQRPPAFRYRESAVDVVDLKRRLFSVPVHKVEDPTMEALLVEKQRELSLKLDLIDQRGNKRFRHLSAALYGPVDDSIFADAQAILDRPLRRTRERQRSLTAEEFAAAAREEIEAYRALDPAISSTVTVSPEVSTVMVSDGDVLIGRSVTVPHSRVQALIHHEVGTHAVTQWNGSTQPFLLLRTGLAGYEEFQEGVAVFAEHAIGGLTRTRLRTLAARVIASQSVLDGAEFLDTYRLLADEGFGARAAFAITVRVHRSGGFVKDAIYLRGFSAVFDHLARGGSMSTLYCGKFAAGHITVVEEFVRRGVLTPPRILPRFLEDDGVKQRIAEAREGIGVRDL
jgi:uncharacterized protein (TIGR02421 family)